MESRTNEPITQQAINAGASYAPVAGRTRYAVAPGVVGVLNEASEALIEAFEDAEIEAAEEAAPRVKFIRAAQEAAKKGQEVDGVAVLKASREAQRIGARTIYRKAQAALTLEGGARWEGVEGRCNRVVLEAAAHLLPFIHVTTD